jgi:hypothetical protein
MGTCTWTGGDNSFNWSAMKNWSPSVPTEDDDVIIPANARFNDPLAPPGTRVKSLRLEGGGLSTRISVRERFEWLGGTLAAGIDLGTASLIATGDGGQGTRGNITSTDTTLRGAVIAMSEGARFINTGKLASSGNSRFWWIASANPLLENHGILTVSDGTLTVDNVIGLFNAQLIIQPGATVAIKSQTIPSYLLAGVIVTGGGTLQVTAGGRLYAASTARIAAGTTIELTVDGSIEDKRARTLYLNVVGPVAGTQRLTVEGRLLWTGGAIYGDVQLGSTAVLQVQGADLHQHAGGTLRLTGSGILAGPGTLEVDIATLRNEGDLLLQNDLNITTGREYLIDNRGNLRTSGGPLIRLGDNEMHNRARIEVTEATLRLGPLQLAAQSRVTTELRTAAAGEYGRIESSGQVLVNGLLNVVSNGYAPAAGDRLDIVTGGPGTVIASRYARAQFPAPVGGRYLYVSYESNRVSLRVGTNTAGFDRRDPPPNALLTAWSAAGASPYRWVGYYLRSPCHSASWMGKRPFLTGLGLGVAIIYVGQQTAGASGCVANLTTAAQGATDAADAIAKAAAEGFPPGSWIYLDVEKNPAGPPTAGMLAYIRAWVDRVLGGGGYSPGLYLHQSEMAAIDPVVTTAFQAAGRPDRARYWCVGGPKVVAITDPPTRCGVPEATTWQQTTDVMRTFAGLSTNIDVDVCSLANPSSP